MRNAVFAAALSLACLACRGTAPGVNGRPEDGVASVIIAGKIILPDGEAKSGGITINLEGDGEGADSYRLKVLPRQAQLFQVEPGTYRLSPTRSLLGTHQASLKIRIEGRTYRVPFPREILRANAVTIKPRKIAALGVLEARLSKALPGRPARIDLRLDDSVDARRNLVEGLIRSMMDPDVSVEKRENAISWIRALDQSLLDLLSESERKPLYKLAP